MICVLTGKTSSGKDSIKKKLIKKYGYNDIVTYTTRPKRRGEKDGVNYHYITNEEFERKIANNFFAEYKSYKVANGETWYYGCALEDFDKHKDDKAIIILTPNGVRDIIDIVKDNIIVIYVYANQKTIKTRLEERGDNRAEAERRINQDNKDFYRWEAEADKIIYNNLENNIEDVAQKINEYMELK